MNRTTLGFIFLASSAFVTASAMQGFPNCNQKFPNYSGTTCDNDSCTPGGLTCDYCACEWQESYCDNQLILRKQCWSSLCQCPM